MSLWKREFILLLYGKGDFCSSILLSLPSACASIREGLERVMALFVQIGTPAEEDLLTWAHHSDSSTIPDRILQAASGNQVYILILQGGFLMFVHLLV